MYSQITPQMAQAELARRAALQSSNTDTNAITPEMAQAELARRGIDINKPITATPQDITTINQQYPGMPQWLKSGLLKASTKLANNPNLVGNALQQATAPQGLFGMEQWPDSEGLGTAARAAARVPLEAAQKLGNLTESPFVKNSQWPSFVGEQPQDINHPVAQIAGSLAGGALSAAPLVAGMGALPIIGEAAAAAPSTFLGQLPFAVGSGAATGAILAPPGQVGPSAILGGALGAGGAALGPAWQGIKAIPGRISAMRSLPDLEKEGIAATQDWEKAVQQDQAAKDIAQAQGMGTNPNLLQLKLSTQQNELSQLGQKIKASKDVLDKANATPFVPANIETQIQPQTLNAEMPKMGEPLSDGSDLVPAAKTNLQNATAAQDNTETTQSQKLYKGNENGVPLAEHVVKQENAVEGSANKLYAKTDADLEGQNIVVPRTDQIANLEKEGRSLLDKSGDFISDDAHYNKLLQAYINTNKKNIGNDIMPAVDVLRNYRTTQYLAGKLRNKAFSPGIASDKVLQKQLFSQADAMDDNANRLSSLLESQNLGDSLDTLKEANSIWSSQVSPVRKNALYQSFRTKGYAPNKDVIYSLRGNGPGQAQMRNFITQNPEMSARALGMRYAKNPDALHNVKGTPYAQGDELDQPYLAALDPDTKAAINAHGQALQNTRNAENALEKASIQADQLKKAAALQVKTYNQALQQHAKMLKEQQKAAQYNQKTAQQNIQKAAQQHQKSLDTQLKNYNDAVQQHKTLQLKITNAEHNIANLRAQASNENLSLQKKVEIENKITQAKQDSAAFKKQLLKMGAYIAGGYLANKYL